MFPGGDATVRLTRRIFVPAAKELAFTGRRLDAREGYRLGLVNRVAPGESLLAEARALGEEIARRSPERLRAMKAEFLRVEAMPRFGLPSAAGRIDGAREEGRWNSR